MLAITGKSSMLKVFASCSCGALIALAAFTADMNSDSIGFASLAVAESADTYRIQSAAADYLYGNCLFSAQLASDPALRAAFTIEINSVKNGLDNSHDEGDLIYYTNIDAGGASSSRGPEPSKSIDSFSYGCLSCHDGVMASSFNVRIKNDPNGRVMSLVDIIGGHPVGMEYENYVSVNRMEYRGEVRFSNEMVFADGKVGCLTCHNPLNTTKGHLVMNNDRSELCFACHKK